MTIETASAGIGATMALGAAMLQTTGSATSGAPFVVPIVSAAIGGLMSYAVLRTTVSRMEVDVRDMRRDMGEMYTLLRDSLTKIAHLEGRLGRHE